MLCIHCSDELCAYIEPTDVTTYLRTWNRTGPARRGQAAPALGRRLQRIKDQTDLTYFLTYLNIVITIRIKENFSLSFQRWDEQKHVLPQLFARAKQVHVWRIWSVCFKYFKQKVFIGKRKKPLFTGLKTLINHKTRNERMFQNR